jgi:ABC-2 type transport system ATP-binding protein
MDAIKVDNLTKRYGSFTAVDSINFEVEEGEIFGFLGPNGSGKSTTIRMLTGIIKPDGGTAVVMGHDIKKDPIRAKQVMGVVPEMSNAYVELSAWNNLMLMGELYGVPKRESAERAKKLLEQFGLYDRRDSPARGFSKGMKQRLILCMALINQPSVLVLDEPTSGLDVESSRLIKDVIRELNRAGTTVFLTTHNMEDASQLCERIAIINQGVIATIDRPEALKRASSGLQSIELSFNRMVSAEDLSKFSCIKQVKKLGDKFRLYADDVDLTMGCIMDYARSQNLKIVALNTLAPSLEDIFVSLTHKTKPGED